MSDQRSVWEAAMRRTVPVLLMPGEEIRRADGRTFRVVVEEGSARLVRFCPWCDATEGVGFDCCAMGRPGGTTPTNDAD